MARDHARLRHAIWADPDFIALTEPAQRAYMLALSQPGLNYCGVVPLTLRRWARLAADSTVTKLRRAFTECERARFIVCDEDSEELLFRTFIKHDGVLDSPNICKASASTFPSINSPLLRGVFLTELHRLNLSDKCSATLQARPELAALLTEAIGEGLPEGFHEQFCEGLRESRAGACPCPDPDPDPVPDGGDGIAEFRRLRDKLGQASA